MGNLPLDGVRVLDLSTVLAAPLAASLLGEYGAEVIKVEHPVLGDPVRSYPPFADDVSLHHKVTNRGKSSVTIDLATDAGAELALELAAQVDVVVTNFRPATLRRWGLDYDDLRAGRPDLVVLHLTAFGREGPYADRPGFARIAEAYAGLTHITGYRDRPPVFAGYPLADGIAGMYAAFTVMLALRHRDATGEGQLIDLALFEPMLRMMEDLVVGAATNGVAKERVGNQQANICPNGLFPTADGEDVIIPASTPRMWQRLVTLIGDEELRAYPTNAVRLKNREHIETRIADWTRTFERDELLMLLEKNGVACGRVFSALDLLDDPHLRVRGNLVTVHDEELGRDLTVPAPVPTWSTIQPRAGTTGPRLGSGTDTVLTSLLDKTPADIRMLRDLGAIGPALVARRPEEDSMTDIPERITALVSGRAADPTPVVEEVDRSFLEPDRLGIRVLYSSLNYKDALASTPEGRVARTSPLVPGIDLVGEVVDAAGDFAAGDVVVAHGYDLGVAHHGGYATYARIPVEWAFPLPVGMTPREAMIFGTAGFTAALSVVQLEERGLGVDDGPVLVTGATGGVGSVAVALLGQRGYEVVASSGKVGEAAEWLRSLGASEVMGRVEVPDRPKPLATERWAAVVDCVGGAPLAQVLAETRYGGAVAASGLTAGPAFSASVFPHILRGVALLGIDSVQCPLERRVGIWERMATDLRPRDLDALCGQEIGLADLPREITKILAGGMTGRTVVRVATEAAR